MSQILGFEAVNASLYDRSTAIFEGICAAIRLTRKTDTAIISEGIFPGDLEVLETQVTDTRIKLERVPLDPETGLTSLSILKENIRSFSIPG